MKKTLPVLSIAAALVLAACATGPTINRYQTDLAKLDADCRERGGILQPTNAATGRPETEYFCRLGNASRIDDR